jgi:D-alanyl-D-alanine carboxypeptidase
VVVRTRGPRSSTGRVAAALALVLAAALVPATARAEDPVPAPAETSTTTSTSATTSSTSSTTSTTTESTPAPSTATTSTVTSPSTGTSPSTSTGSSTGGTTSSSTRSGTPWLAPAPGHVEPDPQPLAGPFLLAQIAEAERISAVLEASTTEVAAAMRTMDKLSDRSNALLESLAQAKDTERAATQEADDARAELVRLEARLAAARAVLRDWAFDVYSGGGSDVEISGMLQALASKPEDAGNPLGDLSYITEQRTRALQDVRVLTREQVRLTAAADAAEATATEARQKIESDKKALDEVMVEQRAKIGSLRSLQVAEVEKAGPVASILVGARTPEAQAAARRLRDALSASVVETADVGKPCSDDTAFYPNGQLPSSALCPVWGAEGERLAPGAAASFSALSKAYAAQTGVPLCITDSYRSLAEQVSVKVSRGSWAATPGTSKHGLGLAVDLCGGVQDFGSATHRWMRQNAPLYGWFHPSWAAAGGSLPEPWHWEYVG